MPWLPPPPPPLRREVLPQPPSETPVQSPIRPLEADLPTPLLSIARIQTLTQLLTFLRKRLPPSPPLPSWPAPLPSPPPPHSVARALS